MWVRSIVRPPMGAGALILLVPRTGSLKYTSSAVASICALSIVLHVLLVLVHVAFLMMLDTYPARPEDGASENGWYWLSHVPRDAWFAPAMIAWPFLFCQNPMVRAPELQFCTDALAGWPVSLIVAVLLTVWQPLAGGVNLCVYVKDC